MPKSKAITAASNHRSLVFIFLRCKRCLTKKAEPPPTRGVNRDSGTASANGGWLRRLVRLHRHTKSVIKHEPSKGKHSQNDAKKSHERLHEMVNNESDNSVNPRWQENSPNNAENSAQKSCRDNL